MTGILVTGHGRYAEGVMSAISLVAGDQEEVNAVNFLRGEGVEELKSHMIQAIRELKSRNVLVMVDILGGSPFHVAAGLAAEETGGKNLKIVAGANMASIVQAVFMRDQIPFDQLPPEVAEAGRQGVVDVSAMLPPA